MQLSVIANPIDSKRLSKEPIKNLTRSSIAKVGLVFLGTVGGYYLAKTTGIFSYFSLRIKSLNSRRTSNNEIMVAKKKENTLKMKTDLKIVEKPLNLFTIRKIQSCDDEKVVKFKEIKVEEFEDLSSIERKNVGNRRSSYRRSITVKNPIPNQLVVIGKPFSLIVDGFHVFSSNSRLSLEVNNIPDWLMLTPLNPNPTFKNFFAAPNPNYMQFFDIVISGNYLYTTVSWSGLHIIDVSNVSNPVFKGSYNTPSNVRDSAVVISGNYAYMAPYNGDLHIIDISDPSNPIFKSSYNATFATIVRVAVFENYAYVPDINLGLQILDVSDPSNPTLKSSCVTPNYPYQVVVSGDYAYVMYVDEVDDKVESGLLIVDISDLANPKWVATYNKTPPSRRIGLTIFGNYAYVSAWDFGLEIIDISDPLNPTFKSSYDIFDNGWGITVFGNYAYVGRGVSGLWILDISNSEDPRLESYFALPGNFYAMNTAVSSNYVYVGGVQVIQIIALNPARLILSGIPNSTGKYKVNIKACNEAEECAINSFDIVVKNSLSTDMDLPVTFNSTIIAACIASVFLPLIIGAGIVILKRHRNRIFENGNTGELKEEKEQ
jgi:hypothetical protein